MILLGLSYWKLDEKDMYHSLPENFRNEFTDVFSTKVSPDQVDSVHVLKVVLCVIFVIFPPFYKWKESALQKRSFL